MQGDAEREVERIGEWYLDALVRGEAPSHEEILAAHPHIADLLETRLRLMDMMRAARPSGSERLRRESLPEEDIDEILGALHEIGPPVGSAR